MHRLNSRKKKKEPAYFDHAATTPLDPSVLAAMLPYLQGNFGNASSQHAFGLAAREAIELARRKVAHLLAASPREVIWTSGATESNNLAIWGLILASTRKTKQRILTCASEHKAVLEPVASVGRFGAEPVVLPVGKTGLVDLDRLDAELAKGALLTSIMWVNNETGVIQPIEEVAKLCSRHKVSLHVDATQAAGKLKINLRKIPITMLSMSAHKIYGPKGCGVLFLRSRTKLAPLTLGGGHEKGLRPGTLPVHQIVGMGEACWLASRNDASNQALIVKHQASLLKSVQAIDGCQINGSIKNKVPHILNLSFAGIQGADLLPALADGYTLSSGAACATAKIEASHVLRAMGVTRNLALASVRISMGRNNSSAQVSSLGKDLAMTITRLRI